MIGLYGKGMDEYVRWECELGRRAASALDAEQAWYGLVPPAILDLQFIEDMQ